jgi:hypothetical protein
VGGYNERVKLKFKPMATTPTMKHVGFTIPPPMEEELEQMAKKEHRTKSDLFREMGGIARTVKSIWS